MSKPKERQSNGKGEGFWRSLTSVKPFLFFQPCKAYQYHPLDIIKANSIEAEYIRYLVLEPGKANEPLVCHLHAAAFSELPPFEAISYACGSGSKTARVLCDGQIIRITANLQNVLRRIRLPDSQRKLWVDAICISQQNNEERSHQITLMEHIYKRAVKTLIYLGPDHGQGQDVSSLLAKINRMIDNKVKKLGSWDKLPPLKPEHRLARDKRWKSLRKMVQTPWFSRVWVVQESRLSENAFILYGPNEFPWCHLIQTIGWLLAKARFLWAEHELYLNHTHLEGFEKMAATHHAKILDSLYRARLLGCTVPSDRVYAFLGLPGADNRLIVEPNYSKTHLEVYHELAVNFLLHTCDLRLLSFRPYCGYL